MSSPDIAIIIPFYQEKPGVLIRTVASVMRQTLIRRVEILVIDDGSPVPAKVELQDFADEFGVLRIIEKENGGAGSARNRGLDSLSASVKYIAFLDSDDEWMPEHLENAIDALDRGYDFYFSDYVACTHRDISNFLRVGSIDVAKHKLLDDARKLYEYRATILDHVARQGNVIGTSNVVYRLSVAPNLRFREEFYNGQDFFFWLDIGQACPKVVFSYRVECVCGIGLNIYSGAGWGSDRSLQRLRNEIKIWTSVERIYALDERQHNANRARIVGLQQSVVRDVIHRIVRRKAIHMELLRDIVRMCPGFPLRVPGTLISLVWQKLVPSK